MSNQKPYQKAIAVVWHDEAKPMILVPLENGWTYPFGPGYSARIVDIDDEGNVCEESDSELRSRISDNYP